MRSTKSVRPRFGIHELEQEISLGEADEQACCQRLKLKLADVETYHNYLESLL